MDLPGQRSWGSVVEAFGRHRDRKCTFDAAGRMVRRTVLVRRSGTHGIGKEANRIESARVLGVGATGARWKVYTPRAQRILALPLSWASQHGIDKRNFARLRKRLRKGEVVRGYRGDDGEGGGRTLGRALANKPRSRRLLKPRLSDVDAMTDASPSGGPSLQLAPAEAIFALLYSPDSKKDNGEWSWAAPVEGRTRLVKELFLFSRETNSGSAGLFTFKFTPGPYGPSSLEVTNELHRLVNTAEVGTTPLASGRGDRLMLAPAGGRRAKELWPRLSPEVRADLYRIKQKYSAFTYRQLLVYVYRTYPEFTTNSLIRDEVLDDSME